MTPSEYAFPVQATGKEDMRVRRMPELSKARGGHWTEERPGTWDDVGDCL